MQDWANMLVGLHCEYGKQFSLVLSLTIVWLSIRTTVHLLLPCPVELGNRKYFRVKLFQNHFMPRALTFYKHFFKLSRRDLKQLFFGGNHVKMPSELQNRHTLPRTWQLFWKPHALCSVWLHINPLFRLTDFRMKPQFSHCLENPVGAAPAAYSGFSTALFSADPLRVMWFRALCVTGMGFASCYRRGHLTMEISSRDFILWVSLCFSLRLPGNDFMIITI